MGNYFSKSKIYVMTIGVAIGIVGYIFYLVTKKKVEIKKDVVENQEYEGKTLVNNLKNGSKMRITIVTNDVGLFF